MFSGEGQVGETDEQGCGGRGRKAGCDGSEEGGRAAFAEDGGRARSSAKKQEGFELGSVACCSAVFPVWRIGGNKAQHNRRCVVSRAHVVSSG